MRERGKLITVDGPGGVGKSTTVRATIQALRGAGHTVLAAAQPSETPFGRAVREAAQTMHGRALALAVAADRAHQLDVTIRPALARGDTVLLDRYLPSTLVLQRADGVPLDDLLAINGTANVPGLAVILLADPATILSRLASRGTRHRFETTAADTARELDLYQQAIPVLEHLGYPLVTLDVTHLTPDGAAEAITNAARPSATNLTRTTRTPEPKEPQP
jgi:dTMP kinase